jgi:hypothetical protein
LLEDRTLLTVQFTPGPYVTPANRPDVPLGVISPNGFRPIEPMVAVNSADPGNLAVSSHNGIRVSGNAGSSFTSATGFVPFVSSGGDTDVKFDSQGRLFWSNLTPTGIFVDQTSPVTGANITSNRVTSTGNDDKDFMAIDTNPASPFFNNIYIVWTRFVGINPVFFSRSTNQGASWSTPLQVSASGEGFVWPSDVSVAPNGDVYVAYHSQTGFNGIGDLGGNPNGSTGKTFVLRSTNGGVSFPQKTLAFGPGKSDVTFNIQNSPRAIPGTTFWTQGAVQPWVLADPVHAGNVYVVTANDPSGGTGAPYSRVVFARSTDNGATWSTPQTNGIIAPFADTAFQLFPTAAIDPFGDIVVAWYDNRRGLTNGSGHFLLDVYATYSTDGGLTWADPFQVTDDSNPFDPDPGAVNRTSGPPPTTRIGEYFGITLFGSTAYVAWNGNTFSGTTPVGQQVWFSSFAVSGSLTVTGTAGDDTISIGSVPGNSDFVQVIVNGNREYVGLWSALTGITVAATSGNDTIAIDQTAAGVPITVNLGGGSDTVFLSRGAHNLDNLPGDVTINGQAGAGATLDIRDQGNTTAQTYTITNSTILRSGAGRITYSNLGGVLLSGSSGGGTYTVPGTASGTPVTLTGNGTNTLLGSSGPNTWTITGTNAGTLTGTLLGGLVTFSTMQNLTGGADVDTFQFTDGAGVSGNIDGDGGTNTLDYSAYASSSVLVNLQTSFATGVGGTIANIQKVKGANGGAAGGLYNLLVGNGGNMLTGGNGRRNLLIAGNNGVLGSTLLGGDDQDILIGGTTAYDMDLVSLQALATYWAGTDDYNTRVMNLRSGTGVPLLDATTVTGNGNGNTLTGGPGLDLFYGNLSLDMYDWDPMTETFISI